MKEIIRQLQEELENYKKGKISYDEARRVITFWINWMKHELYRMSEILADLEAEKLKTE